jgi:hypothetical protein
MKKTDYLLLLSILLYTYLFYQQSAGINVLLFTAVLLSIRISTQPSLIRSGTWLAAAAGTLVTAAAVAWYGTSLALIANVLSLFVLTGLSLRPQTSFLIAALNACYSLIGSVILSTVKKLSEPRTDASHTLGIAPTARSTGALKTGLPILITLVFFLIYREANPAFKALTDQALAGWFSVGWLKSAFLAFLLLFGFFYPYAIDELTAADLRSPDQLTRRRRAISDWSKLSGLRTEYQIGWLSLALLNGLLLLVNGMDGYYLLITGNLPEGVSHATYVHQGIYALIFSIILAIALILYFFRGNLNFFSRNRQLKMLAGVWIVQNGVLVITTAAKTAMYVTEFGLTYKRIGVFVYLLLAAIGLIITAVKISRIRSNWFLFRKTAWTYYAVLVMATFVPWDRLITQHNLTHLQNSRELDLNYLIGLSDGNIPQLESLYSLPDHSLAATERMAIRQKKIRFREAYVQKDWQSWTYDSYRIFQHTRD